MLTDYAQKSPGHCTRMWWHANYDVDLFLKSPNSTHDQKLYLHRRSLQQLLKKGIANDSDNHVIFSRHQITTCFQFLFGPLPIGAYLELCDTRERERERDDMGWCAWKSFLPWAWVKLRFWSPDEGKRSQAMALDNQWEESGWQAMGVASHSPVCVGYQP